MISESESQKSKSQSEGSKSTQSVSELDSLINFMGKKAKEKESQFEAKNKAINKLRLKNSAENLEDEMDEDEKLEDAKKASMQKNRIDIAFIKAALKDLILRYFFMTVLAIGTVYALINLMPIIVTFFCSGIHNIFKFLFTK